MSDVLIMTSTIHVGGTPYVVLRDKESRLLDYLSSLLMWTRYGPFDQIVYCDNSIKESHSSLIGMPSGPWPKLIEFLFFDGNVEAARCGKGYGEGRILEHIFSSSALIPKASSVYKVTGRLFVSNIDGVVGEHFKDENVFAAGDTRFFKTSVGFFRDTLLERYREVDDINGRWLEAVYDSVIFPLVPGRVSRFRVYPEFLGRSAGLGIPYGAYPNDVIAEAKVISEQILSR